MDEKYPGAVDDHPRRAEVEQIWYELNRLRPEEALGDGNTVITTADFPLPLCLLTDILVPAEFLDGRSEDQLAFGLAYAACLSVGQQYIEDAVSLIKTPILSMDEDSLLAMPTAVLVGSVGGLLGGFVGIWRGLTRFASRERDAIDTSVNWLHEAGYDPNQGVSLFMSLAGWFEDHKPESRPEPDVADRVRLGAAALVVAPFFGAVAAVQRDDPPMTSAADRAAAVRAACVALGVHH